MDLDDEWLRLCHEMDHLRTHGHEKMGTALKKPLLFLTLLAKIYRGEATEPCFRFSAVEEELRELILDFGGRVTQPKPEQPFYHAGSDETDALWRVTSAPGLLPDGYRSTAKITALRDARTFGWLRESSYRLLKANPARCLELIGRLLNRWWSGSLHEEILSRLGVPRNAEVWEPKTRKRDSRFSAEVLKNYAYQCGACGFDLMVGGRSVGLEGAHIRWHAFDGPDRLENGIALCKFHHWAFDRGLFTFESQKRTLVLSPQAVPRCTVSNGLLTALEGQTLRRARVVPDRHFLDWHRINVYHG